MKAICLLSGGLDSATTLWWAKDQGYDLLTLSFLYEGRPAKELEAARRLSRAANARHLEVHAPILKSSDGTLQGYLPKRNLIFYSIAAAYAEVESVDLIVGGHLRTDSEDFPDASAEYLRQVESLVNVAPGPQARVKIVLPLIGMTKPEAIRLGLSLGCPLELSWSCYADGTEPCGRCAACIERLESLQGVQR